MARSEPNRACMNAASPLCAPSPMAARVSQLSGLQGRAAENCSAISTTRGSSFGLDES